jgi:hypothetical protein
MSAFSAEDVLRFLERKLHGNFQGQVTTDRKKRPEGRRIKHRMKNNSIKWYAAVNLLRVETTINQLRKFRVLRVVDTPQGRQRRWQPMGKGVANLWRYAQVGRQAKPSLNSKACAIPKPIKGSVTPDSILSLRQIATSSPRRWLVNMPSTAFVTKTCKPTCIPILPRPTQSNVNAALTSLVWSLNCADMD